MAASRLGQHQSVWARSRPAAVQHAVSCSGPPPTGFQSPSGDRSQPEADTVGSAFALAEFDRDRRRAAIRCRCEPLMSVLNKRPFNARMIIASMLRKKPRAAVRRKRSLQSRCHRLPSGRARPRDAFRMSASRCIAASPNQTFAHRAA